MKKAFILAMTLLLAVPVFAQQKKDVNGVNDTTVDKYKKSDDAGNKYARPESGSTRKGKKSPVLFLIGDSTMRTGTKGNGSNGQWGWGAYFAQWMDTTRISVENHALGGTSSRTFYNQLWPDVLAGIRKGDYVIIQLGHNDNGPLDTFTARNSLHGINPDTVAHVTLHDCRNPKDNGREEDVYSYGEYMRKFIRDVRARKATPILCSLTPRNSWDNDTTITRKLETITAWQKAIAAEMQVDFIDLEAVSAHRLEKFGHRKTDYMFYYIDKIHTSRFGAENNAYSAALALQQSNCPLKDYLVDLTPATAQVNRRPGKPVVWLCGDSTCKNDDRDSTGMWGWGSQAYTVFDSTKCTFANEAKAGRSCRTYLREGRWDKVYNSLQPGDIVLIQFGHNDTGNEIGRGKDRNEIATGLDSTHVYKHEVTGEYLTVYSFGWYLRKFIDDAREKGATPILLSLTPRNIWPEPGEKRPTDASNGPCIERRNDSYGRWYREVIQATGVQFIDVHNLSADFLDGIGREAARAFFNHDHTHTSLKGGRLNARSVQQGMRALGYNDILLPSRDILSE